MNKIEVTKISKQLIAEARITEVFDVLLNFVKSNEDVNESIQGEILLLASRYNSVKSSSTRGAISNSELNLETNRLIHALLYAIDNIEKTVPSEKQEVTIEGSENVIVGRSINIAGNFQIGDEIKSDEKVVEKLVQNQSKIKILFLSSNPLDANPLRLDKEMRDLEIELKVSKNRDLFEFIKFSAVRIKDLQDALLNHQPHFVHFSGHGRSEGVALLDNQADKVQIIQSEPLANLFKLFSNDIACVFLNSCYSREQAKLIRRFIPNVIGMNKSVPDSTAIEFATVFYKGIGAGREIGFSFELAKNSIDLHNIPGSDIPVLL